jgi:Circularly permutated YpsA SLOG family
MKVISGGQTGADRAALDAALNRGYEVGGWVPRGRLAEDGRIDDRYPGLVEAADPDPSERTRCNVRDADATLIVSHGALIGGSRLTFDEAGRQRKRVLHLDLDTLELAPAAVQLREWLANEPPAVLNVAGPRASEDPEIYVSVKTLLDAVLEPAANSKRRQPR